MGFPYYLSETCLYKNHKVPPDFSEKLSSICFLINPYLQSHAAYADSQTEFHTYSYQLHKHRNPDYQEPFEIVRENESDVVF